MKQVKHMKQFHEELIKVEADEEFRYAIVVFGADEGISGLIEDSVSCP